MAVTQLRIDHVLHDDATNTLTFNFISDELPGPIPAAAQTAQNNGNLQVTPARFKADVRVPKSNLNPASLIWMSSDGKIWEANWVNNAWVVEQAAAGSFRVDRS